MRVVFVRRATQLSSSSPKRCSGKRCSCGDNTPGITHGSGGSTTSRSRESVTRRFCLKENSCRYAGTHVEHVSRFTPSCLTSLRPKPFDYPAGCRTIAGDHLPSGSSLATFSFEHPPGMYSTLLQLPSWLARNLNDHRWLRGPAVPPFRKAWLASCSLETQSRQGTVPSGTGTIIGPLPS